MKNLKNKLRSLKKFRNLHKKQLNDLSSELEKVRDDEIESVKLEHSEMLKKWKETQEEGLKEEKIRLDNEAFDIIQNLKAELKDKLENLKAQSETEVEEFTNLSEKTLNELKLKYEEVIKELQSKHQNEIKDIEESHRLKLELLKKDKETELLHCEGEWEDRLTATSLSQKAQLESLEKEHEGRLARLKADWEREETEIRKRRIPVDQQPLPVDYEKLRCEKRLLEDKYRSLKEKYVQLKSDMKIAVEKKLQARARRKREEMEKEEAFIERPKNLNTELQSSSLVTPKITVGEVSPRDITDPSSDDQYTLSSSFHPDRYGSSRKGRSHRRDHTPTSRLNEGRNQVDEISGDIYLRHPLSSLGLSRSAEVDFYRQRLQAEEENVRAVRENLEEQKRHLDSRDAVENNNTFGLQQQERDLNDLEVSLHRTRALFSEKMIRLRLLGQTLSRLADDTTSPPSSSGGEVLSPTNVLQNLDNINAEIREIWNQLNKNQSGSNSGGGTGEDFQKAEEKAVPKSSNHQHRPSKRSEIEARLQGLRDWLQKPPPPDWAQLTL